MARKDFKALKDLLPQVLSRVAQDGGSARGLAPVWQEAVGPVIARHSTPVAWEGKQLLFTVLEARWSKELAAQEPELRARLRQLLGKDAPERLVFRVKT